MTDTLPRLTAADTLPRDAGQASLAGRVWLPEAEGPAVVKIASGSRVIDITKTFPTMRDLCESANPARSLKAATGPDLGSLDDILAGANGRSLLAPIDLQAIKAAGVTFAISMLERVIEERARGNPEAATAIRATIKDLIGEDLSKLKAGSPQALELKKVLIERGAWSQYLEVGIGVDAEIFTKSQPMAAVGHGALAGIHPSSAWNNPEPEVVLAVASDGRIVGAALGNDVNLRDVEGRSALLLGKAKDNNASCAIGPFIRFFDEGFSLDHVRKMQLALTVEGTDGYKLQGASNMARISRDPADLAGQMLNAHHHYPDGAVLFLGTLFAPVEDRDVKGQGFTHKRGDVVTVSSAELGRLVNVMVPTDVAPAWRFGVSQLMRNLARRGLL